MPRRTNPLKSNGVGSALLRDGVMQRLGTLGFAANAVRVPVATGQNRADVLIYDTCRDRLREPYAAIVLCDKGFARPLIPVLPRLDKEVTYAAFTDGTIWSWYQTKRSATQLVEIDGPPPPPSLPPGGRWLEPIQDKRAFKQLVRSMNVALRDSRGGGIVERFDVISAVLFARAFDEREVELGTKDRFDLERRSDDMPASIYERVAAIWNRACAQHASLRDHDIQKLTDDAAALFHIVGLLQDVSLLATPGDIKGVAYEEVLRNTFEKNENQQFFTPHEVVAFMASMIKPQPNEVICDPACGTGGFLVEAFRQAQGELHVVGADVDARLARVAQMNLIMHGASQGDIHYLPGMGSLVPLVELPSALRPNSCDVILTNPPFGSDLNDDVALGTFEVGKGRPSRRRSVLFVERCLDFLRPVGRLGIVLDDSVLNLPSNADVRALVRSRAIVEAVVSLPDVTFMPYSTAKSSILFLRKRSEGAEQGPIFMAEANEVGRRPNGDPLYAEDRDDAGNRVLLNNLPSIAAAYAEYQERGTIQHPSCFSTPPALLDDRLDIFYYHPKRFAAEAELQASRWRAPMLDDCVVVRTESVTPSTELGDSPVRWLGLGDIEEGTGEFEIKELSADKIKSAAHVFKGGDILFSRLRPNLRKVILIPDEDEGGLCSAEIIVLQALDKLPDDHPKRTSSNQAICVDSTYLGYMLRSDLVYGQLLYKVTGVGRPRVSLDTLLSVKIPIPHQEEQLRMVSILRTAREASLAARHEAATWLKRATDVVDEAYEQVMASLTTSKEDAE